MLYITTRNKFDTYTAHKANQSDRGDDGGLFLPFRMPSLEVKDLLALKDQTYCQRVAGILNLFYNTSLTAWDVELCGGKSPVKLIPISLRMVVAETWYNHNMDFAQLESRLAARIYGGESSIAKATSWVGISIRIATLFAIYGELLSLGATRPDALMDIAVASGDFAAPMAAWYAREMGLPVGNIICGDDNAAIWDLLHQGQVRTDGGMPENMERLINATLGVEENLRYCAICEAGRLYATRTGMLEILNKGMYAAVTSQERVNALIPSVYRMAGYVMGPETAKAYGGLQDYRARTGENRLAVLVSDKSPSADSKRVASCMDITEQALQDILGA